MTEGQRPQIVSCERLISFFSGIQQTLPGPARAGTSAQERLVKALGVIEVLRFLVTCAMVGNFDPDPTPKFTRPRVGFVSKRE